MRRLSARAVPMAMPAASHGGGPRWQQVVRASPATADRCPSAAVLGLRASTRSGREGASLVMNTVAVVTSERLARYGFGDGHPFGQDRLAAFVREFTARGLAERVTVLEPRTATEQEMRSFHSPE